MLTTTHLILDEAFPSCVYHIFSSMRSKDMLSNKKHDTTSWDHVVELKGSSHDIQEWQGNKQYEEQYIYIHMHVYREYMYYIFTKAIIYLKAYYIHHAQKIT